MNAGTCPFAAQGQSAPTCPLGFGSAANPDASSGPRPPSSTSPALTCPLGFGGRGGTGIDSSTEKRPTPASFATDLPRMPVAVLAAHPTLVAVKGVVFDVSDVEAYRTSLAAWTGHDASRAIAVSGGASAGDNAGDSAGDGYGDGEELNAGLSGLRYEEHQRLEAYFVEMARSRRAVAVLTDEDHIRWEVA